MKKKTIAEMVYDINDEYQYTVKKEGSATGVSAQGFLYDAKNEDRIFIDDANGIYTVFDGVGGGLGGAEIADLSRELLSLNTKSERDMEALLTSVAVGVHVIGRIMAKHEKEEINYDDALELFNNEYQERYEQYFGVMPRHEIKFIDKKYYENIVKKGSEAVNSGSTVAVGAKWCPNKKEVDIGIVGDAIAYIVQDGAIVFESTFRGINTCSGYVTGTYEDYKIYAKKIDEAFPDAWQQRKLNELSYNKISGAISTNLDFFVCNNFSVPYHGENNYLVLVSDGYSDTIAPCDVAYISKQSVDEQDMLYRLEQMLVMRYVSMVFSYHREKKYKNKLYYNALDKIIKSNKTLEKMYATFSDGYEDIDGHKFLPEWSSSHSNEEERVAIVSLLKTLDNSPMVYDEYSYHRQQLLEEGKIVHAHSAFNHFRQSILMAKRSDGPERYIDNMTPSVSRMLKLYGYTITKFVKCDNYSIIVKKLS